MSAITLAAERIDSSPDVRISIECVLCNSCTGHCFTAEVWAHDVAGTGERVCVRYVPHLATQHQAVTYLGHFLSTTGRHLRDLERARYLAEHQPPLFDA